jgi:hypothetical protein
MDSVQKHNNCINTPLSQTFKSYDLRKYKLDLSKAVQTTGFIRASVFRIHADVLTVHWNLQKRKWIDEPLE